MARLLERLEVPVVVDADALFGLEPVARTHPTVLTPHAGELARLLDRDSAWVDAHRLEAARECAERYGAVVVLKGAGTIVQAPTGGPVVCDTGPPSLATAGTGDVLTGVVAAFLAKGLDPVTAAAAAATVQASPRQCAASGRARGERRDRGTADRAVLTADEGLAWTMSTAANRSPSMPCRLVLRDFVVEVDVLAGDAGEVEALVCGVGSEGDGG